MRKAEEEELARPSREQGQKTSGTLSRPAERQPLRAATSTWLEAGTISDKGIWVGGDAWGVPLPLGLQHLKEPLGDYPGCPASISGVLGKGLGSSSTQRWDPALLAWHEASPTSSPLRAQEVPTSQGVAGGGGRGQQQPPPQLLSLLIPCPWPCSF